MGDDVWGKQLEKYMSVKGEVSVSYSFNCCDLRPHKEQLMGRKVYFISPFEGFHSAELGKV